MIRFKTDENLHPDVALYLRNSGYNAVTVWDEGLRGEPDARLAEVCRSERRAFITLDVGFADIRTYPPEMFSGIVVLRLRQQDRPHVFHVLPRLTELLKREPLAGRLWIVEEHSVRIRGGRLQTS